MPDRALLDALPPAHDRLKRIGQVRHRERSNTTGKASRRHRAHFGPPPGSPTARPWTEDEVSRLIVNPFYAIAIDPTLCLGHEPLVSREEWLSANAKLIGEIGPARYLHLLLDVLEGNYLAAPETAGDE